MFELPYRLQVKIYNMHTLHKLCHRLPVKMQKKIYWIEKTIEISCQSKVYYVATCLLNIPFFATFSLISQLILDTILQVMERYVCSVKISLC